VDVATFELYAIIVFGVLLWLAIVFQALTGLRIVKFKGPIHGLFALGHVAFGWF